MSQQNEDDPRDGRDARDLRALPKAELHLHLLAAMRPATLVELAAQNGIEAPDPRAFTNFGEFQRVFRAAYRATSAHPGNLERLVRECVADAAADGVVWVQPQFNPIAFQRFGAPEEVMESVLAAGHDEGGRRGVGFGLTLGAQRHESPEAAERLARFAARYSGHGVRAFGLTGDESMFPSEPFASAFAIARDAGLTSAPHAGELAGPHSVRSAVVHLGAKRLAHGVRAVEDPRLLEFLMEREVSFDVCLTSNQVLGVYPELAAHPLPELLDVGIRCSLGADDPLMFGPGLLEEYRVARDGLGLSDERLAELARTSIETSDAPAALVVDAVAGIEAWLALPGRTSAATLCGHADPPRRVGTK